MGKQVEHPNTELESATELAKSGPTAITAWPSRPLSPWTFVAAEIALALLLGFFRVGSKSLWSDEIYSARVVSGSWSALFHSLRTSDANMSLYDVLLHMW